MVLITVELINDEERSSDWVTHPNMADRQQKRDFLIPPPPRQAGSPHEGEPPARLWSVCGVFLGCFWGERGRGLLSAVSVSEWA